MVEKQCTKCTAVKPASEFSPDRRARDGLQGRCRKCCRAAFRERYYSDVGAARGKSRDYYRRNPDIVLASNARSRARHPESVAAAKAAWWRTSMSNPAFAERQRQKRAGRSADKAAYDRAYREKNAERRSQQIAEWRARNPERRRATLLAYKARRRSVESVGDSTPAVHAWLISQPRTCFWCGKDCAADFHVDHYMPLARGGRHEVSNLVIACPRCNVSKNAKHPSEFAAQLGERLTHGARARIAA